MSTDFVSFVFKLLRGNKRPVVTAVGDTVILIWVCCAVYRHIWRRENTQHEMKLCRESKQSLPGGLVTELVRLLSYHTRSWKLSSCILSCILCPC